MPSHVKQIDACLPQTQCTRCTYPCCRDYAAAIASGEAQINQCPPGGAVTIHKLAHLTGQAPQALNPEMGEFQPKMLAFIVENKCIGCVLCIKACPVDAIVGASKQMHTVIDARCTGCELCLPVCPTDCIDMRMPQAQAQLDSDWPGYSHNDVALGRIHYERRAARLTKLSEDKATLALQKQKGLNKNTRQQTIIDAVNRRKHAQKTAAKNGGEK